MKAILTAATLLLASCSDNGGAPRATPPPPDPVQAGRVVFDGIEITFAESEHIYDPTTDRSLIELRNSEPPDWWVFIQWTGDRDPGFFDTMVEGELEVWAFDPTMDIWMSIYPMSNISWAQIDEWSPEAGWSTGSFGGTMQSQALGTRVAIEEGTFTAERRQ